MYGKSLNTTTATTILCILLNCFCTGDTLMAVALPEQVIFNFSNASDTQQWMVINDTVMGGVSKSSLETAERNALVFTGYVSLENYGGFCSTSSRAAQTYDLSSYDGIEIRLKGDGKKYKATLKTEASFSGFVNQYAFTTKKGEWMTIRAPFKEYIPVFRGQVQKNAPPPDPAEIKSFGFIIADKQEGPFRLEVATIKAYKNR